MIVVLIPKGVIYANSLKLCTYSTNVTYDNCHLMIV